MTYGGFISANIRKWLIKECLESGDPDNFFRALSWEVELIEDELDEYSDEHGDYKGYWSKQYEY